MLDRLILAAPEWIIAALPVCGMAALVAVLCAWAAERLSAQEMSEQELLEREARDA